jgi:hypothetical protein
MSGQLKGASRMTTQFQVGQLENEEIQNMLTLYKQPATIRDMKQVYFYTEVRSVLTNIEPARFFYSQWFQVGERPINPILPAPPDDVIHQTSRSFYFGNIGTSKEFDISEKVNSLLDVRVPKDKYVFEINLAECTIETDPSGWTNNPDYGIVYAQDITAAPPSGNKFGQWINLYQFQNGLKDVAEDGEDGVVFNLDQKLQQSTKITAPQTLYCRIKELSNGEPYNWSVTNSGDYSIDKSHQLLVRHGDINYSKLTLEYGHLAFAGEDTEYFNLLKNTRTGTENTQVGRVGSSLNGTFGSDLKNNEKFNTPIYIDYNREVFNVTDTQAIAASNPDAYPSFYKGIGGRPLFGVLDQKNQYDGIITNDPKSGGSNIVTPVNRPPYWFIPKGSNFPDSTEPNAADGLGLQGRPLFYSQQAHKIGFRFLIRLIALF